MKVLGIETSCDETAVCLIEASGDPPAGGRADFRFKILGNALTSQAALHAQYGGVFPNLAKREHAKNLVPMLQLALQEAGQLSSRPGLAAARPGLDAILAREPELLEQLVPFLQTHEKPDIDAIAVTHGPGLEPALWVGINFAKALSIVWNIPIVAVNHMEGHIVMSMIEVNSLQSTVDSKSDGIPAVNGKLSTVNFPLLALLISGGHTELVLSNKFGHYQLVGQTRDDAAGEAFDKVARLLGLPYPGGPQISRLANKARAQFRHPVSELKLPRPMIHETNFDFSFSGLKTAVRRIVEASKMTDELKLQLAREFEDAVADVLVAKTIRAAEELGANTIVVGGGVSANAEIRRRLADHQGDALMVLFPPPELATDNAIMIALAGYFHALKKEFADPTTLRAIGNLGLETKA